VDLEDPVVEVSAAVSAAVAEVIVEAIAAVSAAVAEVIVDSADPVVIGPQGKEAIGLQGKEVIDPQGKEEGGGGVVAAEAPAVAGMVRRKRARSPGFLLPSSVVW